MGLIKLRIIKPATETQSVVFGVTIPKDLVTFYSGTYFTITKVDNGILLTSGARDTQTYKEIDLEVYKI